MAYEFSPDLYTGNSTIDAEHKMLIDSINKLLDACRTGAGRSKIAETVGFLKQYTIKHFSHEEQLQTKYNYPHITAHKIYHAKFVQTVKDLERELMKDGSSVALVGKINSALAGWLISHIKQEDVKVAAHIKSVGA